MNTWRSRLETIFPTLSQAEEDVEGSAIVPETVMVVDDDLDWANECAFALRTLGYEPLVARSPDEAMALLMTQPVGIAIVDYQMPGRDGITLAYELRQAAEAQGRKLHFIMATGYATKDVAIDAMRASAADFLEKPVRQADLRKALQRIKGLDDAPARRDMLLSSMSSLRAELQRLSQLIDDPDQPSGPIITTPAPRPADFAGAGGNPSIATPGLADYIRGLLKKESKRRSIGGGDVFGDPAWEMLLDLTLAKVEGRRVSVSSACIASGAPMSTALRLVGRLVDEGVLRKLPDETDRRRHFLIINPQFEQPLLDYLAEQAGRPGAE